MSSYYFCKWVDFSRHSFIVNHFHVAIEYLCAVVAFMCYYDNIGGSIPTWLINWAAKVTHEPE